MINKLKQTENLYFYTLYLFVLLQPVIDVLTAQLNFPYISFGMFIRGIFIMLSFLYWLIFYDSKFLLSLLTIILYSIFYLVIQYNNQANMRIEIVELLKVMYLPIMLIAVSNMNRKLPYKLFLEVYFIYALIIIITYVFNIGSSSYLVQDNKLGFISVFVSPNEISAILVGILPFVLAELKNQKSVLIKLASTICIIFVSLIIGTKVMLFGTLLVIVIFFLAVIMKVNKNKKIILFVGIGIIILALIIIPFTPVGHNLKVALNYYHIDSLSKLLSIDTFDKVVMGRRIQFFTDTIRIMQNGGFQNWIFGLGYSALPLKTIEIDFLDIFCRIGISGIVFYGYSCYQVIKRNQYDMVQLLSLLIFIAISLFAGHVLNAPAVSIYLVILPYSQDNDKTIHLTKI